MCVGLVVDENALLLQAIVLVLYNFVRTSGNIFCVLVDTFLWYLENGRGKKKEEKEGREL